MPALRIHLFTQSTRNPNVWLTQDSATDNMVREWTFIADKSKITERTVNYICGKILRKYLYWHNYPLTRKVCRFFNGIITILKDATSTTQSKHMIKNCAEHTTACFKRWRIMFSIVKSELDKKSLVFNVKLSFRILDTYHRKSLHVLFALFVEDRKRVQMKWST